MPVCVECGNPVPTLYTEYGINRGNIVLTQCMACGQFADKYIEFDMVLIFVDMILHKPQVYRHILFNSLVPWTASKDARRSPSASLSTSSGDLLNPIGSSETSPLISNSMVVSSAPATSLTRRTDTSTSSPSISAAASANFQNQGDGSSMGVLDTSSQLANMIKRDPLRQGVLRLCFLLVLFEVYTKWARMDDASGFSLIPHSSPSAFLVQYIYLFVICLMEFVIFQITAVAASRTLLSADFVMQRLESLVIGLILSSFGKILHIFMVIWDYHDLEFSYLINITVFTSNLEAIAVVFQLPYWKAALILAMAVIAKYSFKLLVHRLDVTFPVDLF